MITDPGPPPKEGFSKESIGVMTFCLVLSFDSMVTFMSQYLNHKIVFIDVFVYLAIYFYWTAIALGAEEYYGFAFSSYFVGTMLAAPFVGLWSQKVNQ